MLFSQLVPLYPALQEQLICALPISEQVPPLRQDVLVQAVQVNPFPVYPALQEQALFILCYFEIYFFIRLYFFVLFCF